MAKFDKNATSDDGTKLEQLICKRNKLITELYCVSRIQDFLHITDEQRLTSQINDFLEIHDIRKGYHFDINTLPRFAQVEPPSEKKPIKSKSSTPVDNSKRDKENTKHEKEDNKRHIDNDKDILKDPRSEPVRDVHSKNKIVQLSPAKDDGIEAELQNLGQSDTEDDQLKAGKKRPRDEETPQTSDSHNTMADSRHMSPVLDSAGTYNGIKRQRTSQPPRETKRESAPDIKHTNYLIRELKEVPSEAKVLFHKENINAKESIYLVMNEKIPSMIPQAIPLSELKFNSQTLPLIKLIPTAHKVLTSEIMNMALNECRIAVVSSRIEELRRLGLWSLRQPKKFIDPWNHLRGTQTHRGKLLEEAKWMFYDFDESKKYKRAVCLTIAQAVMDFWNYGSICCLKRASIKHLDPKQEQTGDDLIVKETNFEVEASPQDREAQTTSTSIGEPNGKNAIDVELLLQRPDPNFEIGALNVPDTDGSGYDEYKNSMPTPFKLHVSFDELDSVERKILSDAPVYSKLSCDDDDNNKDPPNVDVLFEPISKAIVLLDDDNYLKIIERQIMDEEPSLVPFSKRRGMFYGNRRSHYLRPPIAPSLRYLRCRTPTIWLPQDDQDLVRNINTYAYNWELISAHMSSRPTRSYCSNIERRTPWQCFERFIQLNERFQFIDMKGPRAHNAQLWLIEAHKLQQQQKRRISPLGVGEESIQRGHKRLRWASMFEAMRKCIKKRENAPRPNPTQPRKPLDCKNTTVPTPAEMSQLKAQRDDALRRDIQMRRIAKQKLQAAAMNQKPSPNSPGKPSAQNALSSGQHRISSNGSGQSRGISADSNVRVTTQTPKTSHMKQIPKTTDTQYRAMMAKQQHQQRMSPTHSERLDSEPTSDKLLSPTPQEILQKIQHGK